jgi:hypothetical protein
MDQHQPWLLSIPIEVERRQAYHFGESQGPIYDSVCAATNNSCGRHVDVYRSTNTPLRIHLQVCASQRQWLNGSLRVA